MVSQNRLAIVTIGITLSLTACNRNSQNRQTSSSSAAPGSQPATPPQVAASPATPPAAPPNAPNPDDRAGVIRRIPTERVIVRPNVSVLSVTFSRDAGAERPAALVQNSGPGAAEIDGECGWKCPVVIQQVTGGVTVARGEFIQAGQKRTVSADGMATICDNNPLPIPVSCTLHVRPGDQTSASPQDINWSGTVTPSR